jgi:hypothetical protein
MGITTIAYLPVALVGVKTPEQLTAWPIASLAYKASLDAHGCPSRGILVVATCGGDG